MILFRTLADKPFFNGSFTRKILSKGVVRFEKDLTTLDFTWHKVEPHEEMRPDLISVLYYGNSNLADILCKYNNISNPFSLEVDQYIKIPVNPESFFVNRPDIIDKGTIKAAPNLIPRNKKDESRLNYLKRLGTSLIQPNLNLPGDKNVRVENGKVIFGADVTKVNKQDCPTPISRSNVLKNLIESKIFK